MPERRSEAPLTIVPLTYGVMPRSPYAKSPDKTYRLSGDSSLAAMAAIEVQREVAAFNIPVFIPGATFFTGEAADAEYMKEYMSHPKRHNRVPSENIETTGVCTNTPTQIAEIKRRQLSGELGWALVICASWQKEDVQALMQAYNVNGALQADEDVLHKYHMGIFDHQKGGCLFHSGIEQTYEKKVRTAQKLTRLNKYDKKGRIRSLILTRILGQGISDWEFRGLEKNAHEFVFKRGSRIAAKRGTR